MNEAPGDFLVRLLKWAHVLCMYMSHQRRLGTVYHAMPLSLAITCTSMDTTTKEQWAPMTLYCGSPCRKEATYGSILHSCIGWWLSPSALRQRRQQYEYTHGLANSHPVLMCCLDNYNCDLRTQRFDANLRRDQRNAKLLEAAANGQLPRLRYLLQHADIDFADKSGLTALHHAVLSGFEDCVEELITRGSDVDAVGRDSVPMNIAAQKQRLRIAVLLVKAKAQQAKALAFAGEHGQNIARFLLCARVIAGDATDLETLQLCVDESLDSKDGKDTDEDKSEQTLSAQPLKSGDTAVRSVAGHDSTNLETVQLYVDESSDNMEVRHVHKAGGLQQLLRAHKASLGTFDGPFPQDF